MTVDLRPAPGPDAPDEGSRAPIAVAAAQPSSRAHRGTARSKRPGPWRARLRPGPPWAPPGLLINRLSRVGRLDHNQIVVERDGRVDGGDQDQPEVALLKRRGEEEPLTCEAGGGRMPAGQRVPRAAARRGRANALVPRGTQTSRGPHCPRAQTTVKAQRPMAR